MTPAEAPTGGRGTELLLLHCGAVGEALELRESPRMRLEEAVGAEFARLLLAALTGDKGRGSFRLPVESC